jgi:hypothetical protein
MLQLSIPIPNITGRQEIEIAMTVNGQTQKMHFCVDFFKWEDCNLPMEQRVACIRNIVKSMGDEWMVYDIGIPTETYVPLTFVKTNDWLMQRGRILDSLKPVPLS